MPYIIFNVDGFKLSIQNLPIHGGIGTSILPP